MRGWSSRVGLNAASACHLSIVPRACARASLALGPPAMVTRQALTWSQSGGIGSSRRIVFDRVEGYRTRREQRVVEASDPARGRRRVTGSTSPRCSTSVEGPSLLRLLSVARSGLAAPAAMRSCPSGVGQGLSRQMGPAGRRRASLWRVRSAANARECAFARHRRPRYGHTSARPRCPSFTTSFAWSSRLVLRWPPGTHVETRSRFIALYPPPFAIPYRRRAGRGPGRSGDKPNGRS